MKAISKLLIPLCAATLLFASTALTQTPQRMKAVVYDNFGPPKVLRIEEINKPVPNDNQVLVRVRAASANPLDWHFMEGTPYIARPLAFGLLRPAEKQLGVDFAGTIEAVGKNVTQFKPGDDVFGAKTGAFAEYLCVSADRVVLKPANLTFEQAATVPVAAITALQGLRDKGKIQPGQKVLINGASGGVGTFAVQIAKSFGANVTGVCSTRNVEMVRSLGADQVIDYTNEDFTKGTQRYDLVLDNVGNHSLLENKRVLTPQGRYVLVGGGGLNDGRWVGPMIRPIKALMLSRLSTQDMGMMLAEINKEDLTVLRELLQSGKVKPVIDRTYSLNQIRDAIAYLETGRARGKVVINLERNDTSTANANLAAGSGSMRSPYLIALALIGIPLAVLIVPVVLAFVLDRRFRRRNPEYRPYRWGYYFSIMSLIGGLALGAFLEFGTVGLIVCAGIYAVLAWFFARRHRWAWIALTVLSFNPIAWIINFFYFRRRWVEDAVTAPAK